MKRTQKWLLRLILFLALWQIDAHAEELSVGAIQRVSGTVVIYRKTESFVAEKGLRLFEHDRIQTKKNGLAGIILRDNTILSLGGSSSLTIAKYRFAPVEGEYALDIKLSKGKFLYNSGVIGKKQANAVRCIMPIGTVGTLGTKFLVNLEE